MDDNTAVVKDVDVVVEDVAAVVIDYYNNPCYV